LNVTIIICTKNRADSLRETLASLNAIGIPAGMRPEILVVDNGSTDHTAEVVRSHPATRIPVVYVSEPTTGKVRALNTGLARSKGEILLFTDDDLRFPQQWLETMCNPILEKRADAIAGNVVLAPHLVRPWMTPTHRSWLASTERLDSLKELELVGANMAFARSVLDMVPCFDPELGPPFGACEEALFSFQLRKAGFKIGRCQGPAAVHHFEPERLSRPHWLRMAKRLGHSTRYVDYHWRHASVLLPTFRYFRALARYYFYRLLKWREVRNHEGVPEWELLFVYGIHYVARYAVESKRPYNYDLEGLVKLRGVVNHPQPTPILQTAPQALQA
jgi:glycosyltransferase involved in cell wall biosynthesis